MKKILIATNILAVGLFTWLYINGNIVFDKPARVAICNTCTNICSDYSGKGITKYDVRTLDTLSKLHKRNAAKFGSTSNIWFSLDTLKRFIWNIEHSVCDIKIKCDGDKKFSPSLGIRIYFAEYPDTAYMSTVKDLKDVNPSFAKMQTLFMLPTYDSIDSTLGQLLVKHIDFDPTNLKTFDNKRCAFQKIDLGSGTVLSTGFTFRSYTRTNNNTTGQNHGGLCPPVCDGGEAF